jgi:hypothetical protein
MKLRCPIFYFPYTSHLFWINNLLTDNSDFIACITTKKFCFLFKIVNKSTIIINKKIIFLFYYYHFLVYSLKIFYIIYNIKINID